MVKDHTTFISLKTFNMNAFPLYVNMADPYEGVETEVLGTKTLKERKERRVRLYFMRCETNVYLANLCGPLGYVVGYAGRLETTRCTRREHLAGADAHGPQGRHAGHHRPQVRRQRGRVEALERVAQRPARRRRPAPGGPAPAASAEAGRSTI